MVQLSFLVYNPLAGGPAFPGWLGATSLGTPILPFDGLQTTQ